MAQDLLSQKDYWQTTPDEALVKIHTSSTGLHSKEVYQRQKKFGLNIIHKRQINLLHILFRQVTTNPLIIILAIATCISFLLGQHISSYYILGIIIASILLGFWNEYSAIRTVDALLKKISPTALVERNNEKLEIPVSQLTIGDVVLLSQGSIIPADVRFIETKDIEINQSALTGESKTVFKTADALTHKPSSVNDIDNIGYMGTIVENGSGRGVVIQIGEHTEFGKIAEKTSFIKPTTDFQKGLARFGDLIIRVIIIMTVGIFVINTVLGHPLIESLLFSLAIAVGMTPELLPVIVTVSLSHGAGRLAKKHIVVKQLISIENLGNMDVLCTDKTGTLTEGKIDVTSYVDSNGKKSEEVLKLALLCNSATIHHKVLGNAIDVALWEYAMKNHLTHDTKVIKLDEEAFDYNKKAMYTAVEHNSQTTLIVKGAPDNVLAMCSTRNKKKLHEKFVSLNNDGLRIVAVATKKVPKKAEYSWKDATDLTFTGYITFLDVPKKSAKEAIEKLHNLSVITKIITGDNEIITQKICKEVGIVVDKILLGVDIEKLSDSDLQKQINDVDIFARVSPDQKLRIIETFRKLGHTVGYMGDGINDLPSLHSADVGISVNTAVDVAKDAASVVLLRKGLDVIADGVIEGRKTFNNTIKYILMSTSSNFGNMFSAAGASFFLPFLPMTPLQILLTNSMYDVSQLSIPSDNVDPESLLKPRHWNIGFIKNYMVFFGPISSIFDFLTFGIMLFVFHAASATFQTGWFIESISTEILVVFVIRTARSPFFRSRPSNWLLITCCSIVLLAMALPFTNIASHLGLTPLPFKYFAILLVLIVTYLGIVETVKTMFLKRFSL